jgi:hypothetical protein
MQVPLQITLWMSSLVAYYGLIWGLGFGLSFHIVGIILGVYEPSEKIRFVRYPTV